MRARIAIVTSACALVVWATTPLAQQAPPAQQTPPPQATPPVFRAATNAVQVDAYPTKDGKIIEGLTAKDFQVFEDGKPQTIDTAEFVRIEPNAIDALRRDPNTQEEGIKLAADPRNRLFVLFLDAYHSSLSGSYSVARPIVTMLNRLLTPGDLFGVATPMMRPSELILGRRTETIEDQLQRHWTWGNTKGTITYSPQEEELMRCYGEAVALAITNRTREERTLNSLGDFVEYLARIREARKGLIVFTRGWPLYGPDEATLHRLMTPERAGIPQMGVNGAGQISNTTPNAPGYANWNWCAGEAQRAFQLDNHRRFRDLIVQANRANVAFYPVNTDGVTSGTQSETLMALAENTDGLVSITNDFNAGLRKIADDMSAFYLLTYSPTNNKTDGGYRKIEVKVTDPSIRIKARRGYTAAGAEPKSGSSGSTAAKPSAPAEVTGAIDVLSRLRLNAELFSYGVVDGNELAIAVELPSGSTTKPAWQKGADVQLTVTGDTSVAPVTGRIDAGARGVVLRAPKPAGAGPYRMNIKVTGAVSTIVTDRVEIAAPAAGVLGEPIIYRGMPAGSAPLRPAADFQFYRTERVHVEFSAAGPLERREGRLLGRDGVVRPIPVQITERERDGRTIVSADLGLSALAMGDYVLEVTAVRNGTEAKKFVPIRVVR